ncbi:MAG: hypothetical protein J3K34DRAFT_80324 [Monoraphidium minutum]|nr:MAG: hypothetical protein J3K34DRAFT_80324 [Monoraphidium minutum]
MNCGTGRGAPRLSGGPLPLPGARRPFTTLSAACMPRKAPFPGIEPPHLPFPAPQLARPTSLPALTPMPRVCKPPHPNHASREPTQPAACAGAAARAGGHLGRLACAPPQPPPACGGGGGTAARRARRARRCCPPAPGAWRAAPGSQSARTSSNARIAHVWQRPHLYASPAPPTRNPTLLLLVAHSLVSLPCPPRRRPRALARPAPIGRQNEHPWVTNAHTAAADMRAATHPCGGGEGRGEGRGWGCRSDWGARRSAGAVQHTGLSPG